MTARGVSIRLDSDTAGRLDECSRRLGQSRSALATTLVEEGLRMEAHPGIVFRPGPVGRRPGLAGGPDVWEVIQVYRRVRGTPEHKAAVTAKNMGLSPHQVLRAAHYYADYKSEIDAWIDRNNAEASAAYEAWLAEHPA